MKRLFIDLDISADCEDCGKVCSYIQHAGNNGINTLRELAHFAVVCRRCDDAPCVASCPWEAIEKQPDKVLKRYMMRCTSCKSCSNGCPFGTIYPETIPLLISKCDFCLGRLKDGEKPICLESCSHDGIQYGDFEEKPEEGIYKVSDYLIVKTALKWDREPQAAIKK